MNYINQIFKRLDVQQIRSFLLHGVECVEMDSETYEKRLADAWKSVNEMIKQKYPGVEENDKITDEIIHLERVIQNVHLEVGLRCGAVLATQLLSTGGIAL